jgi:hypothetical protein
MEELAALAQALLTILFLGGLALWAQWSRKNRGAEIGLIVTVLFVSFLVMALGLLVGLVGLSNTVSDSGASPGLVVASTDPQGYSVQSRDHELQRRSCS